MQLCRNVIFFNRRHTADSSKWTFSCWVGKCRPEAGRNFGVCVYSSLSKGKTWELFFSFYNWVQSSLDVSNRWKENKSAPKTCFLSFVAWRGTKARSHPRASSFGRHGAGVVVSAVGWGLPSLRSCSHTRSCPRSGRRKLKFFGYGMSFSAWPTRRWRLGLGLPTAHSSWPPTVQKTRST